MPDLESSFHFSPPPLPKIPAHLEDILLAMEAIPIGVTVTDETGRVVHVNSRVLQWLGRDREEVVGQSLRLLAGGSIDDAALKAMHEKSLAGGWRGEFTCVRKDGSSFPVYLETNVLRGRGGDPPLVIGVARDITDQRALQARLIAEEKAGTLGLITRNVAHQVRNHLSSISMSLYFLEESVPPSSDGETHIDAIRQEMNRIKLFLDSLASYAHPSAPEFEEASLIEVVNQGLDEARPILRLKSVAVRRQFPPDGPVLRLDRAQLARAVAQVAQNSAESMEHPGAVHVVIKRQSLDDRVYWLVEIRDDGKGIAPNLQERVFEPFFTTSESQIGLGLTMARRAMELHGGEVRLESAPGRGTVVTLVIPAGGEETA